MVVLSCLVLGLVPGWPGRKAVLVLMSGDCIMARQSSSHGLSYRRYHCDTTPLGYSCNILHRR